MIMLINLAALLIIAFIIYWFWFSKPRTTHSSGDEVLITLEDGVYDPARIEVKAASPLALMFLRKDPSPCAEKVIFAQLGISEDLPVNQKKTIRLKIDQPGEYTFTCQMQMYRGTLVVT